MDWSVLGPAAFSLGGVLLGTAGSVLGQYLATRTRVRQLQADSRAALRAERKEAIREFLEAAQRVEHIAEIRYQHGRRDAETAEEATHRLWYLQKCIDLVGSRALREAARDYAWRLDRAVYQELPADTDVWDHMTERRDPFLAAARAELDVPDPAPDRTAPGAR